MTMPEARVVCHSVSPEGQRLATLEVKAHRFILAEINTHRMLSRNYRSSRAVPVKKLIQEVRNNPAMPVFWGKNQPGMQAAEELDNTTIGDYGHTKLGFANFAWVQAAHHAADSAAMLDNIGAHKQIVNRLLEPFLWVNGVLSATEWDNFFGLRLHKDAQPEFRALADVMWAELKKSTPDTLKPGEWHLPFVDFVWLRDRQCFQLGECQDFIDPDQDTYYTSSEIDIETAKKVSAARCARVSYNSFDTGKRSTVEEDLKLFDRLMGAQPFHASPCEHQATPDEWLKNYNFGEGCWAEPELHGNFHGWSQFRKMIPGEAVAPLPEAYV